MKYKNIIWDWNGTLLDDLKASLDAVNNLFDKKKMPNIDVEKYRVCLGSPITKFYGHFFDLSKVNMTEIVSDFYSYIESHFNEILFSKGAIELVDKIDKAGIKQYIFSAASTSDIIPYLKRECAEKYFSGIWGANDREIASKMERGINNIGKLNINPAATLVIGDSCHDFDCAVAMKTDVILLTTGHQDLPSLKKTGAVLANGFEELDAYIFQ